MTQVAVPEPAQVVCFGELLMRLSPPADELLLQSPRLGVYFGGAEANVAVSLAVLGQRSTMVSTLPAGPLGAACARELRRHGVDVGALRQGKGRLGLYFLVPGARRRAAQVVYDRAHSAFALAPADAYDWPRLLVGASWLHLSGIDLAVSPAAARASLSAVRAACELGVKVSFDCNFRATLWAARVAEAPALLRDVMAAASLVFAGAHELAWIVGGADVSSTVAGFADAARAAFVRWPRLQHVATTEHVVADDERHRLRGALAQRGGSLMTTQAYTVDATLGRVGSGDAFAAGILYGLLRGRAATDTLEFATAAACLKYAVPGDANLLDAGAMDAFAASRPGAVVR